MLQKTDILICYEHVPVRVLGLGKFPATVEENVTLAFRVDGFRFDARVAVGN